MRRRSRKVEEIPYGCLYVRRNGIRMRIRFGGIYMPNSDGKVVQVAATAIAMA